MARGPRDAAGHSADVFIERLAQDPSDHEAYLALHAHYRVRADFASLTNLVAGLADYTHDTHGATPLYVEAGALAEQRLDDPARAEAYFRRALQLDPRNVQASEALQSLLERAERWSELSELIDEQLQLLEADGGATHDRAVLQYRLGELFSKQFEQLDIALVHYRNAYELDPKLLRAVYEARQIQQQRGDLRAVCLLYEKEAAAEPDVGRRVLLLRELSERCQELADEDGAVSALERARSLSAYDVQLTHALAAALVRRSAREDERTRALDLDRVADLLCDIADTLEPIEAQPFLVAALGHAPWHARALYELEQATPAASRATLAAHWVVYLSHNPDGDLASERRVALAQAYIAAGQPEDAMFTLEPAAKSGDLEAGALLAQLRSQYTATVAAAVRVEPARAAPIEATHALELGDDDLILEPDDDHAQRPVEAITTQGTTAEAQPEPDAVVAPEPAPRRQSARASKAKKARGKAAAAASPEHASESTPQAQPVKGDKKQEQDDRAKAAALDAERANAGAKAAALDAERANAIALDAERAREAALQTEQANVAALDAERAREAALDAEVRAAAFAADREQAAALESKRAQVSVPGRAFVEAAEPAAADHEPTQVSPPPVDAELESAFDALTSVGSQNPYDDVVEERTRPSEPLPIRTAPEPERVTTGGAATTDLVAFDAAPASTPRVNATRADSESDSVDFQLDEASLDASVAEELVVSRRAFETAVTQGNHDEALSLAEHILSQDVLDNTAFEFAERQYRRTRNFRGRAELLFLTARNPGHELGVRRQRLRDAISLFEQKLLDLEAALKVYRVLIEIDAQNDDALRGMARLLERLAHWDDLCTCLEQSLQLQREPAQQVSLLRRLAELHRRERHDRGAAADTLTRLIELDPSDRAARVALTEDLTALSRWPELTQLLERRIEETSGKSERVALLRQLANVFERYVDDIVAAFAVHERILELVPDDAQALTRMEEIDDASENYDRLLSTLNRRVERASTIQAASLLVRMATIAEADLMDQPRAHAYLRRALELSPNNTQILTALANLCERAGRYDELLTLLRERAQAEKQGKLRAELERRIARVLTQHIHDEAGAAEAYAQLNQQYGDDLEAWTFLEQYARKRDDRATLCTALQKLAQLAAEPFQRRAWLFEAAQLLAGLGRHTEAIDALARILLELDAHDSEARTQLETLCEQHADYRGLARVLEELLSRAEAPAERVVLAKDLSQLYASHLPDDAREVKALLAWSNAAPEEPAPYRSLAAIYERKRRHKELLEALDALSRLEPDADARAAAQLSAAELCWTRLKDADGCIARIGGFVRASGSPLPAPLIDLARKADRLAELSALCEAVGRYGELFSLLRERIEKATDHAHKIDLYRQLATALIEHEQDDDGALAAYEGMLALGDDSEALRFVQAWAIRHDDPERLVRTLARLARNESDAGERRDLWMERGRLLRVRLARPKEAIEAFQQVLGLDPEFWPAIDELVTTCELAEDHAGLAAALERKLQNANDPDDPVALLRRLTNLYEGVLADDRRAVHALTRWVELDASGPEPLRRLRAQYERSGQARELVQTLDALASCERDPAARIEATVAAALLAEAKLADSDSAMARLAPLVPLSDAAADSALLAIAERARRLPEVYDLLERAGRYADLAEQLERAAQLETDPPQKAAWWRRAARNLHERLNDAERTTSAYAALLAIEEDAPALRFMQARALEADDPAALAQVLTRLSKLETDPHELRDLLYDYAHLQNFRLRGAKLAIPVLRRILSELDPEFEPALDELISAAEAADDPAALAEGLSRTIEREADHERRAELCERLATLYEQRLSDDASAERVLDGWVALEPTNLVPRRKLRALLQKNGQHLGLLHCLDGIVHRSEAREERIEAAMAAARLCLGPLRDLDQAFRRFSELMLSGVVQAEDALHTLAFESGKLDGLCELYEQSQRYDDLCSLLRERAESEPEPELRANLHVRCARLLANTIGDEFAAAEEYREALALREDKESLEYLRTVTERQDDVEALDDVLARLIRVSEASERPELQLARALLLRDRLAQPAAAIALLTEVVNQRDDADHDIALRADAIAELEATADQADDWPALAFALEAQLEILEEPAARREIALRLADLYEEQLPDPSRAAQALHQACVADPRHLEARQRLRPHLQRQEAWPELVAVLDALALLETTHSERRAAGLLAARFAYEKLGDAASAMTRLTPLILAADAEAEQLAQTIGRSSDQARELARLYVQRARQTTSSADAEHCWRQAMLIHEQWLAEPHEAFEASLRLLAADPANRAYLDDVDRLAIAQGALERLSQVYAKLVRAASNDGLRIELSLRLSKLLEAHEEPTAALEFALQAARCAPRDPALIERVERLASKQASHLELAWAQEQRAGNESTPEAAIEAWLAVARTADVGLGDREQANAALRRALALTERAPACAADVERAAAALDQARPELGKEDARRALLRAHLELAEHVAAEFRTQLILRAAQLARETLADEAAGFDVLRSGAAAPPFAEALLDALEEAAVRIGRLDALDAQLSRSVERTDSEADKRRLLARRARLLKDRLQRFDQAAQVYERLLELSPSDTHAAELLAGCLRKAGRPRELLRACERRLTHVPEPERKLPIMREMATIWEVELKNRASAMAIWNDVRALAPQDEEAAQALLRLNGD